MAEAESALGVSTFFMMDENFLLHRTRALRLLELMKLNQKSWGLAVFASANAIQKYSMKELVDLGISWIWIGLESPHSSYSKLNGTDTRQLTRKLREHGIRVQGSTIVGLEHHTPENIEQEIQHAITHNTDFHQFMLYTPVPGTPLYRQIAAEGRLDDSVDFADIHGQYKFNFRHAAISSDDSKRFLDWAFRRDFECNGPSLYRMCETMLKGWLRYKNTPDLRVRKRFKREVAKLSTAYNAALWAMEREFREINPSVSTEIRKLRKQIEHEFGMSSRAIAWTLGPFLQWATRREQKRLARGWTYEPPSILERNNWPNPSKSRQMGAGVLEEPALAT
jgi:hypothetical protein